MTTRQDVEHARTEVLYWARMIQQCRHQHTDARIVVNKEYLTARERLRVREIDWRLTRAANPELGDR